MIAPSGPIRFCVGRFGDETWLNQMPAGTSFGEYRNQREKKQGADAEQNQSEDFIPGIAFYGARHFPLIVVRRCWLSIRNRVLSS